MNYYEMLGVAADCEFAALKKAYYRRARECHPDLFGNSPAKTEEFKDLVEAFVTLSDPDKRKHYDGTLLVNVSFEVLPDTDTIMDTDADDTLEELIVGNNPPSNTTLFTFFRDLEKTVVFMTSREARNLFAKQKYRSAARLYEKLISMAPLNILYRVYYARCLTRLRDYKKAAVHYKTAIAIGKHRDPPQHLHTVRKELRELSKKQMPFLHKMLRLFSEPEPSSGLMPDEEMIAEAERAMAKMLRESPKKNIPKQLK